MRKVIIALSIIISAYNLYCYDSGKKPMQAMALSLAIPGGGQFYNESYYKAGLIFALEGVFAGRAIYHHNRMNHYYDKALASSEEDYEFYRKKYYRYHNKRQNDFWWLGSIVFLSIVDAFVDAHLYNYNIERERVQLLFDKEQIGIGIRF